MTDENDLLGALPLADRLRIAAVDLHVTGAPRALVEALCLAVGELAGGSINRRVVSGARLPSRHRLRPPVDV